MVIKPTNTYKRLSVPYIATRFGHLKHVGGTLCL